MARFASALVAGLGQGSVYALIAMAFVIIYKSTLVINFAQPALMVTGGVTVAILATTAGLNFWLALLLGALLTALLALVIERVALRPMVGRPVFAVAVITLGVDIVLRSVVNRVLLGPFIRPVGDPWGLSTVTIRGVFVQQRFIWMLLVTSVIVTTLFAFFKYTRIGLAMRATAFDQEVALAQGISVGTVFALSWAIAGALGAVAGAFIGTGSGLDQVTWIQALKALPAIILGGLDSVGGAVIGGLAVGVVEALVATYQGTGPGQFAGFLGSNFSTVTPYLIMLLVLLVRPYGLFGTPEIERV